MNAHTATVLCNVAILGLSLSISYAAWVKLRVFRLRCDFLQIREALFDVAFRTNSMDDPGYISASDHLIKLVHMADSWSVTLVAFALLKSVGQGEDRFQNPIAENAEMQEAIDDAYSKYARRLSRYIMHETMAGWVVNVVGFLLIKLFVSENEHLDTIVDQRVTTRLEVAIRSKSPVCYG